VHCFVLILCYRPTRALLITIRQALGGMLYTEKDSAQLRVLLGLSEIEVVN